MVSFLFLSQRESPREGGGDSIYPETVIPDYPETVIPDIFYRESTSAAADANFFHRDT